MGHARTFWIAALRAAERGGQLILRNEDLDPQRCRPEFVEAMIEDLRWLGIELGRRAGLRWALWSLYAERAAEILSGCVAGVAGSRDDLSVYLLAEGCGAGGWGSERFG